jgi:parallel beta-helix repeat protein
MAYRHKFRSTITDSSNPNVASSSEWNEDHDDTSSVLYYGADPTGTIDSTAAIVAAFAANNSVLFPDGEYITTARLELKSGLHIRTESRGGAVLKPTTAVTNACIIGLSGDAVDGVTIEGLTIDGANSTMGPIATPRPWASSGLNGIQLSNATNFTIKGCKVINCKQVAIQVLGSKYGTITDNTIIGAMNTSIGVDNGCQFITIDSNRISDMTAFGIHIGNDYDEVAPIDASLIPSSDCTVSNNIIDAQGGGDSIGITPHCVRIAVVGNICYGPTADNCISLSGDDCTCIGNTCLDAVIYGIGVLGTNCTIEGNVVKRAGAHGIFIDGTGDIQNTTAMRATITGNTVSECQYSGITTNEADDVTISGNLCFDNNQFGGPYARAGIYLRDASGIVVTGNRCFDTQTPKTQSYGLLAEYGATATLTGNDFSGNLIGTMSGIPEGTSDTTSVSAYGATGTGATDDTVAIEAAIAANAGGEVFFPSGHYLVTSTITIPDNTSLRGTGDGPTNSTIVWTGTGFAFISDTSATQKRVNIEGLRIECDGTNSGILLGEDETADYPGIMVVKNASVTGLAAGQIGIKLSNVSSLTMDNVTIGHGSTGGTGLLIWADAINTGVFNISNCGLGRVPVTGPEYADGTDIGCQIDGPAAIDSIAFNGCYFGGRIAESIGRYGPVRSLTHNACHYECRDTNAIEIHQMLGGGWFGCNIGGLSTCDTAFAFKDTVCDVSFVGNVVSSIMTNVYLKQEYNCCETWETDYYYREYDRVYPTTPNSRSYRCITPHTSDTEPTWSTGGPGSTPAGTDGAKWVESTLPETTVNECVLQAANITGNGSPAQFAGTWTGQDNYRFDDGKFRVDEVVANEGVFFGYDAVKIVAGQGTPEGVHAFAKGSLYLDNTTGYTYRKTTTIAAGNTGWKLLTEKSVAHYSSVQAAITAMNAGDTLNFEPIEYSATNLTFKAGVRYVGYGTTIKQTAATNDHLIEALNAAGIVIEGITFDAEGQTAECDVLHFDGCDDLVLRDVRVLNGYGYETSTDGAAVWMTACDNLLFDNCHVHDTKYNAVYLYDCDSPKVIGGDYSDNGLTYLAENGITVVEGYAGFSTRLSPNALLTGVTANRCGSCGISLNGQNNQAIGCIANDSDNGHGINIGHGTTLASNASGSSVIGGQFNNNHIYGISILGGAGNGYSQDGVIVSGAKAKGNGVKNVYTYYANGCSIDGLLELDGDFGATYPLTEIHLETAIASGDTMSGSGVIYADATPTDYPTSGLLKIGSEEFTYTAKSGDTFTGVTRAANSTSAADHAIADHIEGWHTTVRTLKSGIIPAGQLGERGGVFIKASGTKSGTSGNKMVRLVFGSHTLITYTATTADNWYVEAEVVNVTATAQRVTARFFSGTALVAMESMGIDENTANAITISLQAQAETEKEWVTSRMWMVESIPDRY